MNLNFKRAAVRGVRTFAQALAGLLLSVPVFKELLEVQLAVRQVFLVALANAALIGFVAFLQNIGEDATNTAVVSKE